MCTAESGSEKYLEYGQESVELNNRSAEKRFLGTKLVAPICEVSKVRTVRRNLARKNSND
ncbi:hypothetical protein FA13DRAFT_1724061, partial [Coprinellus micaceus]